MNHVDPREISNNPDKYLLCFSLYDVKNLLDINPKSGTYIYSSSEAFEEEGEYDFIRLYNWLEHFNFKIHGFDVKKQVNKLKPTFEKGLHASGHVSSAELIKIIEKIDPEIIIPVHTDNQKWFTEKFNNVKLINNPSEKLTFPQ